MPLSRRLLALVCVLVGALVLVPRLVSEPPAPRAAAAQRAWRVDDTWHDGLAEKAVYEATRTIYGQPRSHLATAYTNQQHMDPATTVKSAAAGGVEVFKHHWSERVPTANYDYDFSTAAFVETADLSPFKLTVASQEDCGASFKQVWRDGGRLRWFESVYHPGAGLREGTLRADALVFEDALPLVLRDFPFEQPDAAPRALTLLPSQKTARRASFQAQPRWVVPAGAETLTLPIGELRAWRLDLVERIGAPPLASYWFAAEGAAPWLHVLVRQEGPDGIGYRLRSLERTAYWEGG